MQGFFGAWRKGWKVWLMIICMNVALILLVTPVLLLDIFLLKGNTLIFYCLWAVLLVIFGPAIIYSIFSRFYARQ